MLEEELLLEAGDVTLQTLSGVVRNLARANLAAQCLVALLHVGGKTVAERADLVDVKIVQVALLASKQGNDLVCNVKRGVTGLLEQLGHARTVRELVLRGGVEVGAELCERLLLGVAGQVKAQRAGNIRTLDLNAALKARGYVGGGYIASPTVTTTPVNNNDNSGAALPPELMRRLAEAVINIDENGVSAPVVLTELEKKQQLRDRSRKIGSKKG